MVASVNLNGFQLVDSWDYASDIALKTFTDARIGACTDLVLIAKGITLSVSGTLRWAVSVDGGSNYLTNLGDYVSIDSGGNEVLQYAIYSTDANATAARGSLVQIWNPPAGVIRPYVNFNRYGFSGSITTTSVINALQFVGSAGGNLTGGLLRIYGR